jgi:hypothetical protein
MRINWLKISQANQKVWLTYEHLKNSFYAKRKREREKERKKQTNNQRKKREGKKERKKERKEGRKK